MVRNSFLFVTLLVSFATGCATSYQPRGASGGFQETKLNDRTYQVRFEGNGYTSSVKVSSFLLRRAAELTLENGFRYFVLADQHTQSRSEMGYSFAQNFVTVRFLNDAKDDPLAADAVTVIRETDEMAKGRLSPTAKSALEQFASSRR